MPQSQAQSDYLKSTLQKSNLNDDQRQAMWDTFHQSKDQNDFVSRINKMPFEMNDDAKQAFYDLRYKPEKYMAPDGQPIPPSQQGGGGVSAPSSPENRVPAPQTPPTNGSSQRPEAPNKTWDQITGTLLPQAMAPIGKFLNQPITKNFGIPSYTDRANKVINALPSTEAGGVGGAISDTMKIGLQTSAGLADFAISPAGFASEFLTVMSGGAMAAPIATAFGIDSGSNTIQAAQAYRKNPTPDNLQTVLTSGAMTSVMAAGAVRGIGSKAKADGRPDPYVAQSPTPAVAPPVPRGEGTSAVNLIDAPPSTSPEADAQSHTAEIQRMQSVIDNPKATPQERAYALQARDSSIEVRDNLARPQSRAEITEKQPGILPPRIAPEIAPEPVEKGVQGLAPEHQEIVNRIESASGSPSAGVPPEETANRKMVEDLGGNWKGSDQSGLSHFDVPEGIMGRKGVTVSAPTDKLTPDYIKEQFQRKAQEFAPKSIPPDADAQTRLNTLQGNSFRKIVELKNARDAATDDSARAVIEQQIKEELGKSKQIQDLRIQVAGPEGLQGLRDEHSQKSQWYKNRERGINNLQDVTERNALTTQQISEMRVTRPEGEVFSQETGQTEKLDTGEAMRPLSRSIFDTLQNRKPRYTLDDLQVNAAKEGTDAKEWKTFTDNMQADLRKRYSDIVRDISIHQDTNSGTNLEDTDIPDRMTELDKDASLIGQFDKHLRAQKQAGIRTDVGRRPHLAPPIDADGNITDPAALWKMDQQTWQKVTDTKAHISIPESSEVRQFAKNQGILGQLHDMARAHVDKVFNPIKQAALAQASQVVEPRNPEAGFAGEREPKPFQVPSVQNMVTRARQSGFTVTDLSKAEKGETPDYGWLSPDGKTAISFGEMIHGAAASKMLPEIGGLRGGGSLTATAASMSMIDGGWIRKATHQYFEVGDLTDKATNSIEMDSILSGRHGHSLIIDVRGEHGTDSLSIDRGWEDLASAIKQAKARQRWLDPKPNQIDLGDISEAGKVPGAINLGAASLGAVGGHIIGGPLGAVAGFTLGYISPELIRTPFVQDSFKAIGPFLSRVGVDAKDWVYGSKRPDAIIPQMKDIIDQQRRDPEGSGLGFLERVSQLPTDARRYLINKFAILDDQRTPNFTSTLSKYDARLPSKRPSIDNSPYVSLADAAGNISGQKDFNIIQFSKIYTDAMKTGLDTHLQEYLNLKGYKRVYEVLQERVQDGINQIKAIDANLAKPDLSARDRIKLEDERASVKSDANGAFKKLKGDEAVPAGIKYTDLPDMFNQLSKTLGPQKMAQIDGWAQQVFKYGRQALNMAHDNGVIGDKAYQKFIARGDEYIPMSRIMSDLADTYAKYDKQGKSSPMYLSKQNIIRNLEGSERVNQNPLKASMMMNNEIIAESFRNKVAGDFIDYAKNNPDMYGPNEFKKVGPNYQAIKGEAIITHYEDGQPKTYKVSQAIQEALQGASPIDNGAVKEALGSFYKLFRAGATGLNLGFQLEALPAEIMRTRVLSPESGLELSGNWMKFGRMWGKNFAASISKSPEWQEAIRNGYLNSGLQRLINPETKLESASLGVGEKIAKLRLVSALDDVLSARSDATKMTGFQMLREQGYSEKAARYNTKRFVGMPDYSQSGALHPAVKYLTMFFNADLQHVAQSMNALADKPERILPILGAVTAMTMALQQWNYSHKDEDGQPLMRKVPFDERDRNFVILTGGTHQVSSGSYTPNRWLIRKPDIIAYTVNPVENLLSKAIGHEERSTKSIIADATKGLTPFSHGSISDEHPVRDMSRAVGGSINPALRIPLEEAANKNFGTGSPIVSRDQIDPRYQATANTPSIYSRVGEATGMSPQRIQHVVSGVTGGLADTVAQQADPLLRGNKPAPLPGSPTEKRQIPIIGQAAARLTGSNIDQEEQTQTTRFYDRVEQFKQVQQTFDYLLKSNPAKAQEFVQQNKKMLALASTASEAKSSLAELGQMRAEVQSNPKLDETTRSTQLANIAKARIRYLKAYNSVFDKYTK